MLKFFIGIRGPNIKRAKRFSADISGTKVSFKAPGYNYTMVAQEEGKNSRTHFDVDDLTLNSDLEGQYITQFR